ncbi:alpha/beta fold hydrolase [sulfur-oxidizing endosymbiont of Gigantopelta aegis]|uniref:alpha/beta fold hydrolase n=1 Tax=sulfur-oxidizing endosymbiont of Gigantopelta aegis TaxID=2794934 RepID=UPI001FEA6394|nr:alpha/beta fold hydrolase [sulfur-oxidizing endosymbiont of Gigantopelta aegis]
MPATAPIIILHGLFGSNRNWHPIARSLSEHHTVYTLDLRNHGKSPHSDIMDYPSMADDVLAFIENKITRQEITAPVNIIGHSMGGKVAMWLALNHPELVQKLVVVDIAPVTYQHDFSDVLAAFNAVPLTTIQSRQEADEYLSQAISQVDLRQFLLQNLQFKGGQYRWRLNLQSIQHSIANITAFPDTQGLQPFLRRVLFVGGGQSDYINKSNRQLTRALFPKASFSMIKSAGHWLHAEQPEIFKALIEPYFE